MDRHPDRWGHQNYGTCHPQPSLPPAPELCCPGKLTSFPAWVFSQTRAEAAGLEGTSLEGEVLQRTLPWNQVSTLPFLMDFKGKSGPGREKLGTPGPRRRESKGGLVQPIV